MDKLIFLGLTILEISKIVMHEFSFDQVKPKYGEIIKLCYVDIDSIIIYINIKYIYVDIGK